MELMLLILVSLVFAVIVFSILDRTAGRAAAIIGCLVTFLVSFVLPFGIILGAIVTVGVFVWSRTKNPAITSGRGEN